MKTIDLRSDTATLPTPELRTPTAHIVPVWGKNAL